MTTVVTGKRVSIENPEGFWLHQPRDDDRSLDNFAHNPKGNQNGKISSPHTRNKVSSESRESGYFEPTKLVSVIINIVTEEPRKF
jgi:hypothetical protein